MFSRLLFAAILALQTSMPAYAVGEGQFYYRNTKTGVFKPSGGETPAEPPQSTAAPDIADQTQTLLGPAGSPIARWVPKAEPGWASAVVDKETRATWSLPGISFSANNDLGQYGLAFDKHTGAISGTPNSPFAINDFTITVTANGRSDSTTPFKISVSPSEPLSVSASQKKSYNVRAGTAFSTDAIRVDNAVGTLTFSKPAGVEDYGWDSSTGTLTWMSTPGTKSYTTTITDGFNRSIPWTFAVSYHPNLSIDTLAPVNLVGTRTYDGSSTIRKPTAMGLIGNPSWSIAHIPSGLTYDVSTGAIAGSVTDSAQQGEHEVSLTVTDDADASQATGRFSINVTPPFYAWKFFTGASLKQGRNMTPDGFNLRNPDGSPYIDHGLSWTMLSGNIPPGITTTPSGELFTFSGKPTAQGSFTSTWKATDNRGWSLTLDPITLVVEAGDPLIINSISDTAAVGNRTYSDAAPILVASTTNLVGTPTWSATGLPDGLTINPSTGVLTGTVTDGSSQGDHIVTIKVTDGADGTNTSTSFKLTMVAPFIPLPYTGGNLKQHTAMAAQGFNLRHRGTNGPYTDKGLVATLVSGSLPSGVTHSVPSGRELVVFSGTPTTVGSFTSVWKVTDNQGWSLTLDPITFVVTPAPLINSIPDVTAMGNKTYTALVDASATNLRGTATWSATGLPSGLTINPSTGVVSGKVINGSFGGDHIVTIKVTDGADGSNSSTSFKLTMTPPFFSWAFNGATLNRNVAMTPNGFNLRNEGNGPYLNMGLVATRLSGSLPPGISFSVPVNSELVVFSGTPTTTGVFKSTWRITDKNGWSLTPPEITFTVNP